MIGQVFETYWLIEYNDNLYIMDQHAAHEKVKYEELMENLKNKQVFSQQLLPPMVITVTYAERQAILDNFDLFMKIAMISRNLAAMNSRSTQFHPTFLVCMDGICS